LENAELVGTGDIFAKSLLLASQALAKEQKIDRIGSLERN